MNSIEPNGVTSGADQPDNNDHDLPNDDTGFDLPNYSVSDLPTPLRELLSGIDDRAKATALLYASLTTLGAAIPFVETDYRGKRYTPVLYFFLLGAAGTGKSIMAHARVLVDALDTHIRNASKEKIAEYKRAQQAMLHDQRNTASYEVPLKEKFLIPANSTGAAMIRAMINNRACLIFDTEADALRQALRAETGDISTAFRQNWEREPVSFSRVTNDVDMSTSKPHVSMVISGTESQILPLVRDVENGLISRINFMSLNRDVKFENPFEPRLSDLTAIAASHANSIRDLYLHGTSSDRGPVSVTFSEAQQNRFVELYTSISEDILNDLDKATTFRAAVTSVRYAMVLTVQREWYENRCLRPTLAVSDQDFQTAIELGEATRKCTDTIVNRLSSCVPSKVLPRVGRRTREWYAGLPEEFTKAEAVALGDKLNVSRSTVYRFVEREKKYVSYDAASNRYRKLKIGQQTKDSPAVNDVSE